MDRQAGYVEGRRGGFGQDNRSKDQRRRLHEDTSGQPLAREAMAYVLAGGRGSRLKELTDNRAKPAVYFGGMSRIIDFALSNAINSGIRRIGVATQYKAHSLIRHMNRAWNFMRPERNELRHSARQPACLRKPVVRRHGGCGLSEHRHHRGACRAIWSFWRATTSTRWITS
jgi:hypothetical protein